jgi:hypothetical protein
MNNKRVVEAARNALKSGTPRSALSAAAQVEYDRLKAEGGDWPEPTYPPASVPISSSRSTPEVRARILEMFKRGNPKYARPFEKDQLAQVSVLGGNWEEYGQVVLQMAILDTLLSIEELLTPIDPP